MTRRNRALSSGARSPRASAPAPRIALPDYPADLTVKPGKLLSGLFRSFKSYRLTSDPWSIIRSRKATASSIRRTCPRPTTTNGSSSSARWPHWRTRWAATLTLLYRLLFLLYAENRDLLPVREGSYGEASLKKNNQPRPEAVVLGRPPRGGRLREVAPVGGVEAKSGPGLLPALRIAIFGDHLHPARPPSPCSCPSLYRFGEEARQIARSS